MAGVERVVLALQEISLPGDLPGECDLGLLLKAFFSTPSVQDMMVRMNQSQLYDQMENRYGTHIGHYADKTMKHKVRVGLPTPYYSYYETGRTHESLAVFADEESVGIFPDDTAPEYAMMLDGSAWGLNNENFDELRPEMRDAVVDGLRTYLRNG
jgi:hypothetical protein